MSGQSAESGAARLRSDVTPEAVVALRLAADNMPLSRPGTPWHGAAEWLRRRADAFEVALAHVEQTTPTSPGLVHDHAPYRPVCNERRLADGRLRGACLNDDGTSVTSPGATA